jgi:ribonucleoside-diphosphate reductase alpha chain
MSGPTLAVSEHTHKTKYRDENESFEQMCSRISRTLADSEDHRRAFDDILLDMRFLPAGRVQAAIGSPKQVTAYNCFVSGTIGDNMKDIIAKLGEAAETMRRGGGIGYDFSTLRPRGAHISTLNSQSSGPMAFMDLYDAACAAIMSAGHRRGAQMGVLRVDHPDILSFIRAKRTAGKLTNFNVSVACTDAFMEAVLGGGTYWTKFGSNKYEQLNAKAVWDQIMESTWDYAEPGVLFIDRINQMNNLYYCEDIRATNPCGEQPLPPYGACLLGSVNCVKYVRVPDNQNNNFRVDKDCISQDINHIVRAMDNVVDRTIYPLKQQELEAKSKRRMGIGVTGIANALEICGYVYGTPEYIEQQSKILETVRDACYEASIELAKEKGAFPLFNVEKYTQGAFVSGLGNRLLDGISKWGIRNSHLTSIAPTGTISLCADNVSSGIEPPYTLEYVREIKDFDSVRKERVQDYAWRVHGVNGKTALECSVQDHVSVLCAAQKHIDSAVSKTCNVGSDVSFDEFKQVYIAAYTGGAKGITTFRADGKRKGILSETNDEAGGKDGAACTIDPTTGAKSCE